MIASQGVMTAPPTVTGPHTGTIEVRDRQDNATATTGGLYRLHTTAAAAIAAGDLYRANTDQELVFAGTLLTGAFRSHRQDPEDVRVTLLGVALTGRD